jgi:hypothetical protein
MHFHFTFTIPVLLFALVTLLLPHAVNCTDWPLPQSISNGHWASVGNHRFRLTVPPSTPVGSLVEALVPWRRRDSYFTLADTFITFNDSTSAPVSHCSRNASTLTSTSASFIFTADSGAAGDYFLYYLPFLTCEYANGACEYNADVNYVPVTHCLEAEWWPSNAVITPVTSISYEGFTNFDAFTDMEFPMSPKELSAFATAPLLIMEGAENSTRIWGGGGESGNATTQPFCVYCEACKGWYLKTGGDPNIKVGWDHGLNDKCCSTDSSDCVWFSTIAQCQSFVPSQCRVCRAGSNDVGCPSWAMGGGGINLPRKYLDRSVDSLNSISITLLPNQNNSFQVLVVVPTEVVTVLNVTFSSVPAGVSLSCFNTENIDFWGRASTLQPTVYGLLPLWVGASVDYSSAPGSFNVSGNVNIVSISGSLLTLPFSLALTIEDATPLSDGNDTPPRLHWLNSRLGNNDASVPRPYLPLVVNTTSSTLPATFTLYGKSIVVGSNGLPITINTFGVSASPPLDARGSTQLMSDAGVDMRVALSGNAIYFPSFTTVSFAGNGSVYAWETAATDSTGAVLLGISGSVDFSGYISIDVSVTPTTGTPENSTISFELIAQANPLNVLYGMGLGTHGGYIANMFSSPSATSRSWAWDGVNGNNGVWLGSTTGGFMLKLKGDDPLWQASVPYDDKSSPTPPQNWCNNGAGGIILTRNGSVTGFSGALPFTSALSFKASLLVTPVKNLNLSESFGLRYAQLDGPANYSFLAEQGASVVNMHQGNIINPWINYPYLTNDLMNSTAAECQALGMKYSIYNTMRELSNRCAETFAMLALDETYVSGDGQSGADWLKEHVGSDFLAAWSTPIPIPNESFVMDAAMRVVALSRWNNFYVEGIQQMMRDFNLDGIYLDEIAYDRVTMMRMKKLLDQRDGVIDHHSDSGAFCDSPVMIYAEHYPFISKLWYGEGFNYDAATPDYWLIEMSGLVFGLTADMLRYPGMTPEHFKGMLFGSSNRWQGGQDPNTVTTDPFVPVALWKLWKDFGISDASLFGWWIGDVDLTLLPIIANSSDTRVTTYSLPTRALLSIASFVGVPVTVQLSVNNTILNLPGSLSSYCLYAPILLPFQPVSLKLNLTDSFIVPAGQGHIFLIELC